jgi:hypothetical protein
MVTGTDILDDSAAAAATARAAASVDILGRCGNFGASINMTP